MRYASAVSALCLASIAGPVAAGPLSQVNKLLARENEPVHDDTPSVDLELPEGSSDVKIAMDDLGLVPSDEVDNTYYEYKVDDAVSDKVDDAVPDKVDDAVPDKDDDAVSDKVDDTVLKNSVIGTPIKKITFDDDEVVKEGSIVAAKWDTLRGALKKTWAKRPQYISLGMEGYPHQVDPDPVPFDVFRRNRDHAHELNGRFATFNKKTSCLGGGLRYACVGGYQQAVCSSGGRYELIPCRNSTVCRALPASHNDAVVIGCRNPAEVARFLDPGATETPAEMLSLEPRVLGYVLKNESYLAPRVEAAAAEAFRRQLRRDVMEELRDEQREAIRDQLERNYYLPNHVKSIEDLSEALYDEYREKSTQLNEELERQLVEERKKSVKEEKGEKGEKEEKGEERGEKEEKGEEEGEAKMEEEGEAKMEEIERDNKDYDKLVVKPVSYVTTTTMITVQTSVAQPEVISTAMAYAD